MLRTSWQFKAVVEENRGPAIVARFSGRAKSLPDSPYQPAHRTIHPSTQHYLGRGNSWKL